MPITVGTDLGQRPDELPLVGREERLDEDHVHGRHASPRAGSGSTPVPGPPTWRLTSGSWSPPRSSRRTCWRPPRGSSRRGGALPGRAAGPDHVRARENGCRPRCSDQPRRALAGRRRARPAADRRGGRAAWAARSGRVERLVGALEQLQVPLAQVREALGIAGMDVRDRAQRPRQGADEDGAARRRRARAPGTSWSGSPPRRLAFAEAVGFPLVAKPPAGAGAQATYRLDDADALQGWLHAVPPSAERPGAAGGVPRRRGAHLRQRHGGRRDRVGLGLGLPAAAAGGAAQPVDAVDGAAAARHRRPGVRRHPRGRAGRRCGRSGCATRSPTWSGSAARTARWPCRRSAPGRRAPSSPRCSATRTTSTSTRAWAELVVLDRFDPPERQFAAGTAYLRGQGRGRVRAVHGLDALQRRLGHLVVEAAAAPARPAGRRRTTRARAT